MCNPQPSGQAYTLSLRSFTQQQKNSEIPTEKIVLDLGVGASWKEMSYRLSNAAVEWLNGRIGCLCPEGGLVFTTSVLFGITFMSIQISSTFGAIDGQHWSVEAMYRGETWRKRCVGEVRQHKEGRSNEKDSYYREFKISYAVIGL